MPLYIYLQERFRKAACTISSRIESPKYKWYAHIETDGKDYRKITSIRNFGYVSGMARSGNGASEYFRKEEERIFRQIRSGYLTPLN